MRGWSVLGSVLLMGSGALVWYLLMARWIDSKAYQVYIISSSLDSKRQTTQALGTR